MAYTTIDDGSAHFQTAIYTGASTSVTVANGGNSDLQPDWIWIKRRNGTNDHDMFDTSRGLTERQWSNLASASDSGSNGISALTDGFTTGTFYGDVNTNGNTFVAWQWKANDGTRTTNTESGDNPAGGYQANTTAGFSIVDYTGTGAAGTMAHGLGAIPKAIFVKNRDEGSVDWGVYHRNASADGNDSYLRLNTNAAPATAGTVWNDTTPTSSVFTIGSNSKTNKDGVKYVAYCFAEIQGYSKFGTYTGNNSADGTFVYTGFSPSFIMIKRIDSTGSWVINDSTRNPNNQAQNTLNPDENWAETTNTYYALDILSNGFKIRNSNPETGGDGTTNVFMALAEHPFVSSKGVPTTAR